MKAALLVWGLFFACGGLMRAQQTLLSEGFEGYQRDLLDANASGLNAGPDGGPGNPWWGEFPPDLHVVGADTNIIPGIVTNLVTPHGGTNMVRGSMINARD